MGAPYSKNYLLESASISNHLSNEIVSINRTIIVDTLAASSYSNRCLNIQTRTMIKSNINFLVFTLVLSILIGCTSDDDDPSMMNPDMMEEEDQCMDQNISYQNDIVPVVNSSCALSGCHVDGFSNGDFTTYAGLKEKADGGQLNSRVVLTRNMPPSNSTGPKSLTEAQILAFECWIKDGAPDN